MTEETITPADILIVGDHVKLISPGVREWKIPATERTAVLTAVNIEAIRADIAETLAHVSDAVLFVNNVEVTE